MNPAGDRLAAILRHKAEEVAERSRAMPLRELSARVGSAPPVRGFSRALHQVVAAGSAAVIAEIKRASPSKGVLREHVDPAETARVYETAGATCLSVLTDKKFFRGSIDDLEVARGSCSLPVLRKDFVLDAWQVYESRIMGADCVLLIVAALGDAALLELSTLARDLGMDVLMEVHDSDELQRALATPAVLIGVNNRNLRSFETDTGTTLELLPQVPEDRLLVTESGILEPGDVSRLRNAGVGAFLVGEALMRAADPGARLRELFRQTG